MDFVKRVTAENPITLSSVLHVSVNDVTLCGREVNTGWWVVTQEDVNCETCKLMLENL